MVQLNVEQRIFIVTKYIETRSYNDVREAFRLRFPQRNAPSKKTIYTNVKKYKEKGTSLNLNKGRSGRRVSIRTPENIQLVRDTLNGNPNVSTRRNGLPISRRTFQRIIQEDLKWHPYRIHVRHELKQADFQRRVTFSRWFRDRCNNVRFLHNLVVGDEASFTMNGRVNTHNVRMYAEKGNPPSFNFDVSSERTKLSVWAAICGNGTLLGPYFFEGNVNGVSYLQMVENFALPLLRRFYDLNTVWWAQDGAPAHRTIAVRNRLNQLFGRQVIGMGHENQWPTRSPDLTPLDFFLWGYLKSRVYITPPTSLEDLRRRIENACVELRETEFVRNSIREMRRRAELCIGRNGHHVEGVFP